MELFEVMGSILRLICWPEEVASSIARSDMDFIYNTISTFLFKKSNDKNNFTYAWFAKKACTWNNHDFKFDHQHYCHFPITKVSSPLLHPITPSHHYDIEDDHLPNPN